MTQQQTQSQFSQKQSQDRSQDASLSRPGAPDATSPYRGPRDEEDPAPKSAPRETGHAPAEMAQPYFSEAQSKLAAFAPAKRPGDHFAEPEDPQAPEPSGRPAEQPASVHAGVGGTEFATASGTVRSGMAVVDSYGQVIGTVAAVEGERLRLASTDPHDDGVAFLPVGLIDGIEGDRVLLGGRGDASFGLSGE